MNSKYEMMTEVAWLVGLQFLNFPQNFTLIFGQFEIKNDVSLF